MLERSALILAILLSVVGCSGRDANCPQKRSDSVLYDDTHGSLRFTAELLESETCDSEFCFAGSVVGLFRIVALIDNCQTTWAGSELGVGDEVPLNLSESLMGQKMQAGERADVACVIFPSCSDGCGTFPTTQGGPCFAFEYGCRTRCYEPLLSAPSLER
jgi:hypothetical protein